MYITEGQKALNKQKGSDFMTKTKKLTLSILAAFVLAGVLAVCFSLNAAATVNSEELTLRIHGREIQGEYIDEIDCRGYRHIKLISNIPNDMSDHAVLINVDAPVGENIRVIDDEETLDKFG